MGERGGESEGLPSVQKLHVERRSKAKTEGEKVKAKLSTLVMADWAIELRPLDMFMVSRYRIAMRAGAKFPALIVDKQTREIISGNHRFSSALAEYGEDYLIDVDMRSFKDRAAQLVCMADENAKHGMPMDGITRRRVAIAMVEAGLATGEVARIMNVPEGHLAKWGDMTVIVMGKTKKQTRVAPVKGGIDRDQVKQMTEIQYEEHIDHDKGVEARHMAKQLTRWLNNDWINWQDERNVVAFDELKEALDRAKV
jgi:hypothetical protein